jgi:hypothetical protein
VRRGTANVGPCGGENALSCCIMDATGCREADRAGAEAEQLGLWGRRHGLVMKEAYEGWVGMLGSPAQ